MFIFPLYPAKCYCTESCGKSCVNFLLNVECDNHNCALSGTDCGNKSIQKRHWIKNEGKSKDMYHQVLSYSLIMFVYIF
jgi:hypothetical protein